MENQYWIVRPIINGFESFALFYGTQDGLISYIKNNIPGTVSYFQISTEIAKSVSNIGMKCYMCPDCFYSDSFDDEEAVFDEA